MLPGAEGFSPRAAAASRAEARAGVLGLAGMVYALQGADPTAPMTTRPLRLLQNAMQAYTWRLEGLASNVANLDTPGYNRLSVRFEEDLQRARRGSGGASDAVAAEMVEEGRSPQLEDELMEIADTQMRTQLATRALHEHFARVRTGITGRAG